MKTTCQNVVQCSCSFPITNVRNLNSGSAQAQILLTIRRRFAMVRISDSGLSWKRGYMVFIGPSFGTNSLSSLLCHVCPSFLSFSCLMMIQHKNMNKMHFFITQYLGNALFKSSNKNFFNVKF